MLRVRVRVIRCNRQDERQKTLDSIGVHVRRANGRCVPDPLWPVLVRGSQDGAVLRPVDFKERFFYDGGFEHAIPPDVFDQVRVGGARGPPGHIGDGCVGSGECHEAGAPPRTHNAKQGPARRRQVSRDAVVPGHTLSCSRSMGS